jgi:beta-phosphoglucomutase-like phosphatase (HAD superfamily)
MTNGNAILDTEAVIDGGKGSSIGPTQESIEKYLSMHIRAADVGAMKPHMAPFIAAVQLANTQVSGRESSQAVVDGPGGTVPSRMLLVGDNFVSDVIGALNAGFKAVYLCRNNVPDLVGQMVMAEEPDTQHGEFVHSTIDATTRERVPYCKVTSLEPEHFAQGVAEYLQHV